MDKYKTSTFLTGLFCKFRLQDKEIRKIISEFYGNLIDIILKETVDEKRILLFRSLVPIIKNTIDYFENIKKTEKTKVSPDEELFKIIRQLIEYNAYIIQKIGIRYDEGVSVFDKIMKQVLIDDIACDIGECIKLYRKTDLATTKADIIDRLKVLLTDYNVIMQTNLNLDDVLKLKENE